MREPKENEEDEIIDPNQLDIFDLGA